jgi:dienelactone hydrolase
MPTTAVADIPVLWEEPARAGERKLVIWLPGFTSSKESVHEYLCELAAAGYVALSFDPVDHGARSRIADQESVDPASGSFRDPATGKLYRHFWSILAETAAEAPSVIDWAIAELSVAPPVGMGGISMGGNIAVAAAALDRRIAAVAAGIAEADWLRPGSTIPLSAPNAYVQDCFDRCNPLTNLANYRHCPAISFQCGADDTLIPPGGAQRFVRALSATYAACPEKLEIEIEDGVAHEFTPTMWRNSLRWLARFL